MQHVYHRWIPRLREEANKNEGNAEGSLFKTLSCTGLANTVTVFDLKSVELYAFIFSCLTFSTCTQSNS